MNSAAPSHVAGRPRALARCSALAIITVVSAGFVETAAAPPAEPDQSREGVLRRMATQLRLTDEQLEAVLHIAAGSPVLGQGNPALTEHPMTRETCRAIRDLERAVVADEAACEAPHMVPLFDRAAGETPADARVCIDQFEFPNLPCEYPFVYVRAREAALLCEAIGKRLCDAHEWEGACAGSLRTPSVEYAWGRPHGQMRASHNGAREITWAYGPRKEHARCATSSKKTAGCDGHYSRCGSNTYPAGAFPSCVSPFGVHDLHGNAAEHMSLPLTPSQLGSAGGHGWTEMKGSWFIFSSYEAHLDDCRWRAPDWHGSRLLDPKSHANYHLGFRCCKTVDPSATARAQ